MLFLGSEGKFIVKKHTHKEQRKQKVSLRAKTTFDVYFGAKIKSKIAFAMLPF